MLPCMLLSSRGVSAYLWTLLAEEEKGFPKKAPHERYCSLANQLRK
jgi:hypothetical protein